MPYVQMGVALPSWFKGKTGSYLVMIGYLLLMIIGIPLVVRCLYEDLHYWSNL